MNTEQARECDKGERPNYVSFYNTAKQKVERQGGQWLTVKEAIKRGLYE